MQTTMTDRDQLSDNEECIGMLLAVIRQVSIFEIFNAAGCRDGVCRAMLALADAVEKDRADEVLEPLVAALLSAANHYFGEPLKVALKECPETGGYAVLLAPAVLLPDRPAALH